MLAQMGKCPAGIVEADLRGVGICIGGGMLALKIRTGLDINVTGIMPDRAVWLGADKTQPVSAEGEEHLAGLSRRRGKGKGNINKPVGQPLGDAAVIALPDGQGNRGAGPAQ